MNYFPLFLNQVHPYVIPTECCWYTIGLDFSWLHPSDYRSTWMIYFLIFRCCAQCFSVWGYHAPIIHNLWEGSSEHAWCLSCGKVSQGRLDLQAEASNRLCHSDLTPKSRISLGTGFLLYTCQLALLHRFLIVSVVHGHWIWILNRSLPSLLRRLFTVSTNGMLIYTYAAL